MGNRNIDDQKKQSVIKNHATAAATGSPHSASIAALNMRLTASLDRENPTPRPC